MSYLRKESKVRNSSKGTVHCGVIGSVGNLPLGEVRIILSQLQSWCRGATITNGINGPRVEVLFELGPTGVSTKVAKIMEWASETLRLPSIFTSREEFLKASEAPGVFE